MADPEAISEEVQRLTWSLIDEALDDADLKRLEHLLATDEHARTVYLQCIQLHCDLRECFKPASSERDANNGAAPIDLPSVPPFNNQLS